MDLTTRYMGLDLKSPLVSSASPVKIIFAVSRMRESGPSFYRHSSRRKSKRGQAAMKIQRTGKFHAAD